MSDTIFINEFIVETLIGAYDWERTHKQMIQLDLEIDIPKTYQAKLTDNLAHTIDYAEVIQRIERELETTTFLLIERLGEFIAEFILNDFNAERVKIKITKFKMHPKVKHLGVIIERSKSI